MKHIFNRLLVVVIACMLLSVCVAAADFTDCADELHALGLFKGTGTNADGTPVYSLDRAPTRAEAITMLVRLLGKEAEAQAGTWEVPFTDLDGANAWALPYVGYAYANGLTNGESAELFGTNNPCSAQMYCTLVLRSLGYSDAEGGQFTYAAALEFAAEKGLIDPMLVQGQFLRDHVAAVSYSALFCQLSGSESVLLEKLLMEGAVDVAAAAGPASKASALDDFVNAMAAEPETRIDADMDIVLTMSSSGIQIPMTIDSNIKVDASTPNVEMAMTMGMSILGQVQNLEFYVKDGYMYTNDGTAKVKQPLTDAGMPDMSELAALENANIALPMYYISNASVSELDGVTTYTVTLPGSVFTSLVGTALEMSGESADFDEMTIGDITFAVSFIGNAMRGMNADMSMSMTSEGETIDMGIDLLLTMVDTGDSVVISFPADLAGYVEVIGGANAPAIQ